KVGAQVKNGSDLITLEVAGDAAAAKADAPKPAAAPAPKEAPKAEAPKEAPKPAAPAAAPAASGAAAVKEIPVPDLGGATDVEVIEVMVKVGDVINAEA